MGLQRADVVPQLLERLSPISKTHPVAREKRDLRFWAIDTGALMVLQKLDTLWGVTPNYGFYSPDSSERARTGGPELYSTSWKLLSPPVPRRPRPKTSASPSQSSMVGMRQQLTSSRLAPM